MHNATSVNAVKSPERPPVASGAQRLTLWKPALGGPRQLEQCVVVTLRSGGSPPLDSTAQPPNSDVLLLLL